MAFEVFFKLKFAHAKQMPANLWIVLQVYKLSMNL